MKHVTWVTLCTSLLFKNNNNLHLLFLYILLSGIVQFISFNGRVFFMCFGDSEFICLHNF